ncbi:MAG TPA: glutamine--fructose-6-phosphate transaminase (isomerizing) [Patescibacteria group bacterium]|nr:glutamine--fructose-6-phosphate transaminase (isomerizing) [Patescibacteria group bacterium]
MCGIFAYLGDRSDAPLLVAKGLKQLEYRGYDSWGIAAAESDDGKTNIFLEKHTGRVPETASTAFPQSTIAFGHTRWATHGGVTDQNAHPHLDCGGNVAVIHNGIIENYAELKKRLVRQGHAFMSETDTETLAHTIEQFKKRISFEQAVRKTFLTLTGMNAVLALDAESGTVVAVKNGSPLIVGKSVSNEIIFASDVAAILPYTKTIHVIDDGEMVIAKKHEIALFQAKTGKTLRWKWNTVDWKRDAADIGSFPYYLIKEIHDQPAMLEQILLSGGEKVRDIARLIRGKKPILIGCGTASYAALVGKYLLAHSGVLAESVAGGEIGYMVPHIKKSDIPIFFSQSGETIDIIEPAMQLKRKKIPFAAFVNVLGSTLYRMTPHRVMLDAGPEICVLSTKVFVSKLAHLLLLAGELGKRGKQTIVDLNSAIHETKHVLEKRYVGKYISPLAKKLVTKEHMFMLGRGVSYPIALEAALKIKEVTYLHAEGFAGGELKHGVIALVEDGTPCFVFAPRDDTQKDIMSCAAEVKARGAFVIGVSQDNDPKFDWHIPVKDCGVASIIPQIVVIQRLAYEMAVLMGRDPDKPRNLAKSVVVK